MDDWNEPAQLLWELGSEDDLARALERRQEFGQALGVLMERHHVDSGRAIEMLSEYAVQPGATLQDAAVAVLADRADAPRLSEDACSDIVGNRGS